MAGDVFVVVDRRGEVMGPFTRQQADEYAELWDRDCPDEAPHVVKTRESVKRPARTQPEPDSRCITTGDGGCVGEDCMHTAPVSPAK